ncbi:MAG: GNAT family N-acetyltransferase, partial [Sphingobacteriales bacterium]
MENINIRRVDINALRQLQSIGRQTFYETFSAHNSEENIRKYLAEGFSDEQLTRELQNPGSEFYFAELEDHVIGYLKLNSGEAQTELKEEGTVEIERIYVSRDYHGKKVGQLLYEKAVQVARDKKAACIWLGVWEQ